MRRTRRPEPRARAPHRPRSTARVTRGPSSHVSRRRCSPSSVSWWTAAVGPSVWCAPKKGEDMTNMNTSEFLRGVDHAAAMDDRWLFIASLVVIGMFGIWVMRYFAKQNERLMEDHKRARECYQESLRGVVAEQSATNAKLMVCLDNNSKVLEECRDELRYSCKRKRR